MKVLLPAYALLLGILVPVAQAGEALDNGRGTRAEISDKGVWKITHNHKTVIEKMEIGVWEQEETYVGQESSGPPVIQASDSECRLSGTLGAESLSYEMEVMECGKGIYVFVEQTRPADDTWGVLLDLPVTLFSGVDFVLDGEHAKVFPGEKGPAPRCFTGNASNLLTAQTQDLRLLVDCGRRHGMVVQDARHWDSECYQVLIYPREGKVSFLISMTSLTGSPEILRVFKGSGKGKLFEKCELDISFWGEYGDPYDRDDVRIRAEFISASGSKTGIDGFYYREFLRTLVDGKEMYSSGEDMWKIRFSPTETGTYSYAVTATTKNGTSSTVEGNIEIEGSKRPGYVGVSGSGKMFGFSDGAPFFAVGHNVCWTTDGMTVSEYDRYFSKMAEAGENFSRIWLCSWGIGLETAKLDEFDLEDAWKLDQVITCAEKNGIYVKLCLENFWDFTKKKESPYWKQNGGFCAGPEDFFVSEDARKWLKRKYRYIISRWGYSPNIFAWELWNEMDYALEDRRKAVDWTRDIAAFISSSDNGRHMITTSLGVGSIWPEIWDMPEMDFVQIHTYIRRLDGFLNRGELDAAKLVLGEIARITGFGKPAIISEYGYLVTEEDPGMNAVDTTGIHLHNGLWASALSGAAGTCMPWWWDIYIEKYDLYYHMKNLANFLEGEGQFMQSLSPVAGESPNFRVLGLKGPEGGLFWLQNKQNTWYNITVKKQKIMPLKNAKLKVSGLEAGRYSVQWWDTYNGGVITGHETDVHENDGILEAEPPAAASDVACKVRMVQKRAVE